MFNTRTINLYGKEKQLKWIQKDLGCFDIIQKDWIDYSNLFLKHVSNTSAVLQAGGNCGLYPYYYSFLFDRVFTFEPDPMNFYCLSHNCTNSKIIKFNTALSNKCGYVNIGNPSPDNIGMSKIIDVQGTIVYTLTIDSLNIESLGLIHLDVEGEELNVLRSAVDTITRCKPVIVSELSSDKENITSFLKDIGYNMVAWFGMDPINGVFLPRQ